MNIELFALAVVVAIVLVGGVPLFYGWLFRFSNRTANDVFPFLLKIDMEGVYGTFHPDPGKNFRENLSEAGFKEIQVKRFHLALHYCNQLSNNALVLLSWTRYERKQDWIATSPAAIQNAVQDLRVSCLQFLVAVFFIRTRLRWWLFRMALLPFATPPSFESLLAAGGWDMISLYERVQQLAELFSLCFGDEYHDKLTGALHY
jgi:hypothetical protein